MSSCCGVHLLGEGMPGHWIISSSFILRPCLQGLTCQNGLGILAYMGKVGHGKGQRMMVQFWFPISKNGWTLMHTVETPVRLTDERKYEFSRAGVEQQTLFSDSSVTTGCITIFYSLSLLRIRAGVEFKNQGLHFRAIICKCGICPQ
jgi:hypothetical protein